MVLTIAWPVFIQSGVTGLKKAGLKKTGFKIALILSLGALMSGGYVASQNPSASKAPERSAPPQGGTPARGKRNAAARAGITRIVITGRHPAFDGASFGSAGPYEMLLGTAYGELDPSAPGNAGIINLQNAPLNTRGHVEYSVDITILKPVDIDKGNGRLIYDVLNRGHEKALWGLNLSKFSPECAAMPDCLGTEPADVRDPSTALLMKRGYTVVWSGFQGERTDWIPPRPGLLKANYPLAMRAGKPLIGISRDEFTSVPRGPSFTRTLSYPAANLDQAAATLTVRQFQKDSRQPLGPESWSYVDDKHIRITAPSGFDTEALYEFIYPATDAVVEGIAYASIRDFVSFLRHADRDSTGQVNPLRTAVPFRAAFAIGNGMILKDFLYQGFNADNSFRRVFDGIMPAVSGSSRTFVNVQFAQPNRFNQQHKEHLYPGDQFPFTYATTKDPISGRSDGFLERCTKSKTCPRIIHLDSDTELWQVRASLLYTDTSGKPVAIPENVRIFVPDGVPHNSNEIPESAPGTRQRGTCREIKNRLQYRYYLRALFIALDRWVTEGVVPPASRYPNFKDGTLVSMQEAARLWPAIPGSPFNPEINRLRLTDYSKQPPSDSGPEYPLFVARTNADGNPLGGIEPPEITVPTGTYSGRNVQADGFAGGELCGLVGSYIPFAATRAERMQNNDPRLSLEERYRSQEDFTAKRRQAAAELVRQGLLLPEDAAVISDAKLPSMPATAKP